MKTRLATVPQTDRVEHLCSTYKTFITPSLITMQNLVLFLILCAHIESPKNLSDRGAPPSQDGGMAHTLQTRSYPTCVTMPNLVIQGQTIRE